MKKVTNAKQKRLTKGEVSAAIEAQAPAARVISLKTLNVPKPQIEQFDFKGLESVQEVYALNKYIDAQSIDFVKGESLVGLSFFIVGGWRKRTKDGEAARMILRLVTEQTIETENMEGHLITVGGPGKLVHVSLNLEGNANREYLLSQAIEAQRIKSAIGPCTVYMMPLSNNRTYMDICMLDQVPPDPEIVAYQKAMSDDDIEF